METRLMRTGSKVTCIEPAADVVPPSFAYPYSVVTEDKFALYWRLLLKRKWVIVAAMFVCLMMGAISSFRATRLYQAVGRIAIFRENPNALGLKTSEAQTTNDDYDDTSVMLDTQVKIMQSDILARQVIKDLHLETNPSFAGRTKKPAAKSNDPLVQSADSMPDDGLLDRLKNGLSVSVVPRTQIVQVSYMSPDPKLSAQIVNALTHAYIEQNFKTKYDATMQTSEWLSSELSGLQTKVETSQEKLVRYQKEHGILGIDEKQNIVTSKLDELNKQLTQAESDRIGKESLYQISQSGNPDLVAASERTDAFEKLRVQEADLSAQLSQAKMQFGPAYPKVQVLENQLRQTHATMQAELQRISTRYKNEYLAAQQREKMLRDALEQQKQEANTLNESAIEYNLLKRDVDSNRQLYEGLLQKMKEAGVSAGLRSSNVRIVDAARVPTSPAKPDIPRTMMLAFVVGVFASVGLVAVLERIDNTVRTPEEAQFISALPPLGIIPRRLPSRNGQHKLPLENPLLGETEDKVELVTHGRPKSEIAESYRALRTSILLSTTGQPPRLIVVTSPLPQEGKTTTSTNTAIALAQRGARVLLVDADLRRPGIHRLLGIHCTSGLSTLLTGSGTFANTVIPLSNINNLSVLPAGPIPPQPAELLGSEVMHNFIQQWRDDYDHIVIDTPPILSVTDAVLLSVKADSVLLVMRAGVTSKPALRRSSELLQQVNARVVGVVVNDVDTRSPEMQSYYYYGSNYGGYYTDDGSKNAHGS